MKNLRASSPPSSAQPPDIAPSAGASWFEVLAAASPAIVVVHQDGAFRYVNPAAERVLGYSGPELLGMHFWEVIHPDFVSQVRDRAERRLAGEPVPPRYEFKIVTKQGHHRTLDCTSSRLDFLGRPAVLGIAFDVTRQKRSEEWLAAQLAVTRVLADGSFSPSNTLGILRGICQAMDWALGAYWCADPATHRLRCVEVWTTPGAGMERCAAETRQLELAPGEGLAGRVLAQGEPLWFSDLGNASEFRRSESASAAQPRGVFAFPVQLDGVAQHVVEFFCRDFREPDPELIRGFAAIGSQMGQYLERIRAVEWLRASEERLRRLFMSSPVPIALLRGDGGYFKINRAFQEMSGYSSEELVAPGASPITHPEDQPEGQRLRNELMAGARDTFEREERLLHKCGGVIWTHSVVNTVRNDAGELEYVVSVIQDITERKREETVAVELSCLAHRMSSAFSAKEAAQTIADAALKLFAWDAFYLHLHLPTGLLQPVLTVDTINGERVEIPPSSLTSDPSPMMIEVITRGAQLINRTSQKPAPESMLTPFGDESRRSASMMYVPIRNGPASVGVMSVQSYRARAYGEVDLKLLQSLADQCGVALERINAAEKLGISEARQGALLRAIPDLMLCLQPDGTIIDCKASSSDDAALQVRKGDGRKLQDCWPEHIAEAVLLEARKVLSDGAPRIFEFEFSGPGGIYDFEARLVGSGAGQVLAIVRDDTERKKLEKEVLIISSREQQRIGKDLHDGVGQVLTGLAFLARSLQEKLAEKSLPESDDAAKITQLALKATTQARLMARGLYPVELETRGLAAALAELAHSTEKLHRIACSAQLDPAPAPFGKPQEKHIFSIVQEAANNAVKHSQCSRITITLKADGPDAILAICDDGKGFMPAAVSGDGMGLRIMRYRARRIHAQLHIGPAAGGGTAVLLRITGLRPLRSSPATQ